MRTVRVWFLWGFDRKNNNVRFSCWGNQCQWNLYAKTNGRTDWRTDWLIYKCIKARTHIESRRLQFFIHFCCQEPVLGILKDIWGRQRETDISSWAQIMDTKMSVPVSKTADERKIQWRQTIFFARGFFFLYLFAFFFVHIFSCLFHLSPFRPKNHNWRTNGRTIFPGTLQKDKPFWHVIREWMDGLNSASLKQLTMLSTDHCVNYLLTEQKMFLCSVADHGQLGFFLPL